MAVVSLRLNQREENMVNYLSDYYEEDRSGLIKRALNELYEDILDHKLISDFERREVNGNVSFTSADDIMDMLKKTAVEAAPPVA
jgi:predicted DNA-binding protein